MPPITPTYLWDRNEMARRQKGGDAPDKNLGKHRGSLGEGQTSRLDVKLEENSRDDRIRFELSFVMCDTVPICL